MKKALYFDILNYHRDNLAFIKKHFELLKYPDPVCVPADVLSKVNIVFAPLGYFFGKKFMDSAGSLKVIATNTTGTPHIDTDYAKKKKIKVVSLAGHTKFLNTITPTAELTFGLVISLIRRIPWAFDSVKRGKWNRWDFGGPSMLSSMSLGIVGMGRLGRMVARYAMGFGMKVSYYDPYLKKPSAKKIKRINSLEKLVSSNDIITVHIPMNEKNLNLFNDKIFSKFKEKSYFINTSRGEIINSSALVKFLKNGHIAGAAVDVLDGEFEPSFSKKISAHSLVKYARANDNLLITPHIAGSTADAWFLTQKFTIEKVLKII